MKHKKKTFIADLIIDNSIIPQIKGGKFYLFFYCLKMAVMIYIVYKNRYPYRINLMTINV